MRRVHPDGVLLEASPLRGGISAPVTKLSVRTRRGSVHLVLRQPDQAAFEFRLLSLLHERGLPVPRPLWLEPPGPLLARGGLLLSWLPGRPDLCSGTLQPRLAPAARLLARIHAVDGRDPAFAFLPDRPADTPSPPRGHKLTLQHGDYWPGNWVWHEGRLQGILDWEDAHRGDPLEDVANARLEVWIRFGADGAATFTREYCAAAPHLDTRRLAAYDAWAANRARGRVAAWTDDSRERARLTAAIRDFAASIAGCPRITPPRRGQ